MFSRFFKGRKKPPARMAELGDRIGDGAPATSDTVSQKFQNGNIVYELVYSPDRPDDVLVIAENVHEYVSVPMKFTKDGHVRLCGIVNIVPEIIDDVSWFEWETGPVPMVTHWGDRVIIREDHEAS